MGLGVEMLVSLWKLAGSSTPMLPRSLPNFRAIIEMLNTDLSPLSLLRSLYKWRDQTSGPLSIYLTTFDKIQGLAIAVFIVIIVWSRPVIFLFVKTLGVNNASAINLFIFITAYGI